MTRNILKIISLIFLALIIYKYIKDPILIFISNSSLPKKFNSYKIISKASLASQHLEMIKLFDKNVNNILYDSINRCHYIKTINSGMNMGSLNTNIYWKVDSQGNIIDSISIKNNRLLNSGVFFNSDYYIDWLNTGDKTKKKYSQIIEDTNLTINQIKDHIDNAIAVDAAVNYTDSNNIKIDLYIFNGTNWSVLKSKKLYNEIVPKDEENDYESKGKMQLFSMKDSETFSLKMETYLGHFKKRFTLLNKNQPSYLETKSDKYILEVEAFEKKERFTPPLLSFSSHGPAGWYGIGYVKLNYGAESIPFKLEAIQYKTKVETGVHLYYPSIETKENLTFIQIGSKRNRETPKDYYGLYIIRTKQPH